MFLLLLHNIVLVIFLLILLLAIPSIAKNDDITDVKVTSVYDGDTLLADGKDYEKAYSVYEALTAYKPDNQDYEYKMTKCLVKMPFTYSVQKKIMEFVQKDDGSEAEKLATKKVLKVSTI